MADRTEGGFVELDGSVGEGGGQILRTALTLSIITGTPFRMRRIRAGRSKPGLGHQHLAALRAAATISDANVEGGKLGSKRVRFTPGRCESGDYVFDIGTAGSTSLVLQTILLPLFFSNDRSSVRVIGGTHVSWSPCFEYLGYHWSRYMAQLGFQASLEMLKAGYYPKGGGVLKANLSPGSDITSLRVEERGELQRIHAFSLTSNLPNHVGERQVKQTQKRLARFQDLIDMSNEMKPSPGKGTALILIAKFEHSQVCYFGLGARGKSAEAVADEAVDQLEAFLKREAAVDQFLADQILLPLCFAHEESVFTTPLVTEHLTTNAHVIRQFSSTKIQLDGEIGSPGKVRITPQNQD